jgi:hypothetical protein
LCFFFEDIEFLFKRPERMKVSWQRLLRVLELGREIRIHHVVEIEPRERLLPGAAARA